MQLSLGRAKLEPDVFPFKPAKVPKPEFEAFHWVGRSGDNDANAYHGVAPSKTPSTDLASAIPPSTSPCPREVPPLAQGRFLARGRKSWRRNNFVSHPKLKRPAQPVARAIPDAAISWIEILHCSSP